MSRKLFADLQTFSTLEEYRNSYEVNYSTLKELPYNPSVLLGRSEHKDSDAMRLGSMVDTILTEPDTFNVQFFVLSGKKPSEAVVKIVSDVVENGNTLDDRDIVLEVCKANEYRKTWGDDKIYEYIVTEGKVFSEELIEGRSKRLVTSDDYILANQIAKLLVEHEWTSKYFTLGDKDIEIIFQFKFYSKIEGVDCKCMMDILLIDHFAKTIQPLDLKVGEQHFNVSFFKFKWYLQGAMYREALEVFTLGSEFKNYTIEEFKFIHVNTKYLDYPVIYEMDNTFHEHALLGWKEAGRDFLGVYELIEDFKWYEEYRMKHNPEILVPRKLVENNGILTIPTPRPDDLPF